MRKSITLRSDVREHILQMIQSRKLVPGDKVREADICKELNLSRTPVREALIQLATEDILKSTPNRGFTVNKKSTREKQDIYDVLASLDALVAELAFDNVTQEDISLMCQIIDMLEIAVKYQNYSEYSRLQDEFHNVYRKACKNKYLLKIIDNIHNEFLPMTYTSSELSELFKMLSEMNNQHKHIVELFKSGKKEELFLYLKDVHWKTQDENLI